MKTAGTIRVPVRRHLPIVPLMVATGVALVAVGAGIAWHDRATTGDRTGEGASGVARVQAAPAEEWGFVLRADTAQVLRHRPGLEPVDFVRTHAFGWRGVTIDEALGNPVLVKELRLQPQLSPIDLIRLEARGS